MTAFYKYPRTQHLEGSRFQTGDEDLDCVPFNRIKGRQIVVEEKLDGANSGIRFDTNGKLLLQSRGHFLDGGPRERQFDLLKTWASSYSRVLWESLGPRYVMYGEWLYAKHTIFYDSLPHYFLEFDTLDTSNGEFLSTDRRRLLLGDLRISSVSVLWSGKAQSLKNLQGLLGPSLFKTGAWSERLSELIVAKRHDPARVQTETDASDLMEGLYVKVEEEGRVVERYKYIRPTFLAAVVESGSHWMDRPIFPNQLASEVDIFGAVS